MTAVGAVAIAIAAAGGLIGGAILILASGVSTTLTEKSRERLAGIGWLITVLGVLGCILAALGGGAVR